MRPYISTESGGLRPRDDQARHDLITLMASDSTALALTPQHITDSCAWPASVSSKKARSRASLPAAAGSGSSSSCTPHRQLCLPPPLPPRAGRRRRRRRAHAPPPPPRQRQRARRVPPPPPTTARSARGRRATACRCRCLRAAAARGVRSRRTGRGAPAQRALRLGGVRRAAAAARPRRRQRRPRGTRRPPRDAQPRQCSSPSAVVPWSGSTKCSRGAAQPLRRRRGAHAGTGIHSPKPGATADPGDIRVDASRHSVGGAGGAERNIVTTVTEGAHKAVVVAAAARPAARNSPPPPPWLRRRRRRPSPPRRTARGGGEERQAGGSRLWARSTLRPSWHAPHRASPGARRPPAAPRQACGWPACAASASGARRAGAMARAAELRPVAQRPVVGSISRTCRVRWSTCTDSALASSSERVVADSVTIAAAIAISGRRGQTASGVAARGASCQSHRRASVRRQLLPALLRRMRVHIAPAASNT